MIMTIIFSSLMGFFINFIFEKQKYKLRKDEGFVSFKNKYNEEIYIFRKKEKTRISVGILGSIVDGTKILCHKSKRDGQWKPIGGTLKINDEIKKNIEKIFKSFKYDTSTKYRAIENDFRIFVDNFESNEKILKILRTINIDYLINQLKREAKEEMKISLEEIEDIFDFKNNRYQKSLVKKAEDSFLQKREFIYQFILKVNIRNEQCKKLAKILKKNKNIKFIDPSSKGNIAITAHWARQIC